jgi:hypothetical protein
MEQQRVRKTSQYQLKPPPEQEREQERELERVLWRCRWMVEVIPALCTPWLPEQTSHTSKGPLPALHQANSQAEMARLKRVPRQVQQRGRWTGAQLQS